YARSPRRPASHARRRHHVDPASARGSSDAVGSFCKNAVPTPGGGRALRRDQAGGARDHLVGVSLGAAGLPRTHRPCALPPTPGPGDAPGPAFTAGPPARADGKVAGRSRRAAWIHFTTPIGSVAGPGAHPNGPLL